jgi:DNA-binding IscR family transcriptional regulator
MKPSRRVTYAIQAIVLLAKLGANGPVSCGTIARQGQMPERFLLQILRELVNWGLLDSVRGAIVFGTRFAPS